MLDVDLRTPTFGIKVEEGINIESLLTPKQKERIKEFWNLSIEDCGEINFYESVLSNEEVRKCYESAALAADYGQRRMYLKKEIDYWDAYMVALENTHKRITRGIEYKEIILSTDELFI